MPGPTSPVRSSWELSRGALLAQVRDRLELLNARQRTALSPSYYRHVKQVIVVASSPRGGSSVITELLRRRAPQFLQPSGETVPHLTLAGLRYPDGAVGSNRLDGSTPSAAVEYVRASIGRELGFRRRWLDAATRDRFALDLTSRLTMQWPGERFEVTEIDQYVKAAFTDLVAGHGWN